MEQTQTDPITETPQPVYMLRKVRAPERYLANGKYNSKPLSPTYSIDYYHRTKAPSKCEFCETILCHPARMKSHLRRNKKCFLMQENIHLREALKAKQQLENPPHED